MITHGRLASLVLALALVTGSAAVAQPSRQAYSPADVQRKIDLSSKLQQEALASLGNPAQAEELVWKAYGELKAAQSAMIINASGAKFQDPLFDLNSRKADEALVLLQRAGDALKSNRQAPSPPPYLHEVRSNLERAFRLTSLVFAL
jgi:hypothetical protein